MYASETPLLPIRVSKMVAGPIDAVSHLHLDATYD